jgi:hypothetical protein
MNKVLLSIFSLVVFSFSCSDKKTFYDSTLEYYELEYWQITGPVKYLKENGVYRKEKVKDIDLDSLDLENDFRFSFKQDYTFNKEGLMTEQNYYNSEVDLSWQLLTYYNSNSKITKNIMIEEGGSTRYFNEFIYDDAGNQIQATNFKSDSTVRVRKLFTYNKLNQETEEKWTEYKNGPQVHRKYEYDNDGRIKIMGYTDGQNDLKFVHSYNQFGDRVSIITYLPDGTILKKENFEFQQGKLIVKINTNYERGTVSHLHINTKGLLAKVERFKEGEDKAHEIEENQFEYDERGNWIRKMTFINNKLFHIDFRDIEYY